MFIKARIYGIRMIFICAALRFHCPGAWSGSKLSILLVIAWEEEKGTTVLRRPVLKPTPIDRSTVARRIWLRTEKFQVIRDAQATSGEPWHDWVAEAIAYFEKEPPEEIYALLHTWARRRQSKQDISIRIFARTLERVRLLVGRHPGGSMQACFEHALFIHALRCSLR